MKTIGLILITMMVLTSCCPSDHEKRMQNLEYLEELRKIQNKNDEYLKSKELQIWFEKSRAEFDSIMEADSPIK